MKIKLAVLIILTFKGVAGAEMKWGRDKKGEYVDVYPDKQELVESNYTQAEELGFKYVKAMDESEYQTHQRRELQEAESRESVLQLKGFEWANEGGSRTIQQVVALPMHQFVVVHDTAVWTLSEFVQSGKFCEWHGKHEWRPWDDTSGKVYSYEYWECNICHRMRRVKRGD